MPPTFFGVRDFLWQRFPESRDQIVEIEATYSDGSDIEHISSYTYISEILMWGILKPAAALGDSNMLERAFEAIELMFASGDSTLIEALRIRVVAKIYHYETIVDAARAHAGRHLREELRAWSADATWN